MAKWHANKVVDLYPTIKSGKKYIEIEDVKSFEIPEVGFGDGELSGSGIMGTVNIPDPYNIEAMEASITAKNFNDGVLDAIKPTGVNLRLNWAIDSINTSATKGYTSYTAVIKGIPKGIPGVGAEKGEEMEVQLAIACNYYKLIKNGKTIYEIDQLNNKLIINGVDYMKTLNKKLGRS